MYFLVEDDYEPCDDPHYYLNEVTCSHHDFFQQNDVKPIKERNELKDYQNIAVCCPEHGFIYQDFTIVKFIYNVNFFT